MIRIDSLWYYSIIMDDVMKTAEELDEKIYRKEAKKDEGQKLQDAWQ